MDHERPRGGPLEGARELKRAINYDSSNRELLTANFGSNKMASSLQPEPDLPKLGTLAPEVSQNRIATPPERESHFSANRALAAMRKPFFGAKLWPSEALDSNCRHLLLS